ncbi:MAG: hypothetical protein IJ110_02300 [Lachnospiraceae bacterium]|nr:hypothetical protein [Lachnospiraceae bacterium]
MSSLLNRLKKSLICFVALATSASMLAPVSALATETTSEVGVDNHTQGREDAKIVSGITIGDVKAPKEGERLDDKAVVTTAEKETWEIPVIWIGEDLKPDTGLAGKGSYLPVLAYIVPEQYTVRNNDETGRGYKITLSEDLLKLFGENKIISIYESKTGITYILPAKLKDLYAQKGTVKNPTDVGGNEIVPADQVAPYEEEAEEPVQEETEEPTPEQEEKPAQEEETPQKEETPQEEEQTSYTHIVNVHCDQNAKDALTESDLDFLAELVVNTLQPQAVKLLIDKFPAFKEAADNREIGQYITVIVSYDEGSNSVGYASRGRTDDTDTADPDHKFVYSLTVNASSLTDHKEDGKAILTRDFTSDAITNLANTVVHELFHCFSYDYNRPGLTGYLRVGDEVVDLTESGKVQFPAWFVEGTASTVENNWQFRQEALRLLRTPKNGEPKEEFYKDLLVERYVDGRYVQKDDGSLECDYNFDIQYCNGFDRDGRPCSNVPSRYVSGYLACMYLYELAAESDPEIGSSRSTSGDQVVINSEKLRMGMNSIIKRMHNGETLDQVINSISSGISSGTYKDTADFEARFIKGTKDEDGKYSLSGDAASLDFICDFMNYMNEIDKREGKDRTLGANGSVLFDFETDFGSPLSFDETKEYSASVLQPLDDKNEEFQRWARSTVSDLSASSTGGLSMSGKSDSNKKTTANILAFTSQSAAASSEETSVMPDAAKESDGAATAVTAEATETTDTTTTTEISAETEAAAEAAPVSDESAGSEAPESASEGSSAASSATSSAASPVTEEAAPEPAPEAAPVEVEVAAPSTAVAAEPFESEDAPAAEEAVAEETSAEAVTTPAE